MLCLTSHSPGSLVIASKVFVIPLFASVVAASIVPLPLELYDVISPEISV